MDAKQIIEFPEKSQISVLKEIWYVGDMIKCDLRFHAGASVSFQTAYVFKPPTLSMTFKKMSGAGRLHWSFRPRMHHCMTFSFMHTRAVDVGRNSMQLISGLEDVQVGTGLHLVLTDEYVDSNEVTSFIVVDELAVHVVV